MIIKPVILIADSLLTRPEILSNPDALYIANLYLKQINFYDHKILGFEKKYKKKQKSKRFNHAYHSDQMILKIRELYKIRDTWRQQFKQNFLRNDPHLNHLLLEITESEKQIAILSKGKKDQKL